MSITLGRCLIAFSFAVCLCGVGQAAEPGSVEWGTGRANSYEGASLDGILDRLDCLESRSRCKDVYTSRHGLSAIVGARYVEPRSTHFPVAIAGDINHSTYSFTFDSVISPYIEAEWISDSGFGLRGSYWYSQTDGRGTPEDEEDLSFNMSLETQVVDLEFTQDIDFRFASLVYTTGVRYLSSTRNSDNPDLQVRTPRFEGVGPTVSYEFRRRLGPLTLFHSLQTALLYGDESHVTLNNAGNLEHGSDATYLPMGDLEAGVEVQEVLDRPITLRLTWFATAFRDLTYMGLHFHAGMSW